MAVTVYILLALTAILTISNTSAKPEDVVVTKEELDNLLKELQNDPEKLGNILSILGWRLELYSKSIVEKSDALNKFRKNLDDELVKLNNLNDKPDEQKKLVELIFDQLVSNTRAHGVTEKQLDTLLEELLNHPQSLELGLLALENISKHIENKPKILKGFLKNLDDLKKKLINEPEKKRELLKKKFDQLKKQTKTIKPAPPASEPAPSGNTSSAPLASNSTLNPHPQTDSATSATAAVAVVAAGLLASLPLNMVA